MPIIRGKQDLRWSESYERLPKNEWSRVQARGTVSEDWIGNEADRSHEKA